MFRLAHSMADPEGTLSFGVLEYAVGGHGCRMKSAERAIKCPPANPLRRDPSELFPFLRDDPGLPF